MTDLPALFKRLRHLTLELACSTVDEADDLKDRILAGLDEIAERQHDTYHQNGHTSGSCMDECAALRKACRGGK